jgi:hypothetical protein
MALGAVWREPGNVNLTLRGKRDLWRGGQGRVVTTPV